MTHKKINRSTINSPKIMPAMVSPDSEEKESRSEAKANPDRLVSPFDPDDVRFFAVTSRIKFFPMEPALFVTLQKYLKKIQ